MTRHTVLLPTIHTLSETHSCQRLYIESNSQMITTPRRVHTYISLSITIAWSSKQLPPLNHTHGRGSQCSLQARGGRWLSVWDRRILVAGGRWWGAAIERGGALLVAGYGLFGHATRSLGQRALVYL